MSADPEFLGWWLAALAVAGLLVASGGALLLQVRQLWWWLRWPAGLALLLWGAFVSLSAAFWLKLLVTRWVLTTTSAAIGGWW